MKKQNTTNTSDDSVRISGRDLKKIEDIWKINIAELQEEGMSELEDYPELVKKFEASLQVVLDSRRKISKKSNKISSRELSGPILEIFKYVMADLYRTQIKDSEGCKGMYI